MLIRSKILILFALLSIASFQTPTPISIDSELVREEKDKDSKTIYYELSFTSFSKAYYHIKTEPFAESNPAQIFFSADDTLPKRETFTLLSDNDGNNEIFIPSDLVIGKNSFYIGISCPENCSYNLTGSFSDFITLTKDVEYQYVVRDTSIIEKAKFDVVEGMEAQTLFFYVIGAAEGDVQVTLNYQIGEERPNPIEMKKDMLFNGLIAIVKNIEYVSNSSYQMEITCSKANTLVKIGVRENKASRTIAPDSKAIYGYLSETDKVLNDCFQIERSTTDQSYMIDVLTRTRNIVIKITNLDEHPEDDKEFDVELQNQILITDSTLESNKYVCVTPKNGTTEAGYSVQVTKYSDITTGKIEPLVNGISYNKTLTYGQRQYYRHYKHYNDDTEETNYNVRVERGNVETFVHTCTTYPNCNYDDATLTVLAMNNQLIYPRDIGGFHTIGVTGDKITNLLDETQTLLIVKCDSPTCVFKVSFFDEDDKMLLSEGVRFIQVMSKGQNDTYTFSIFNETTDIVLVELTTLAGDSNMSIKKEGLEPKLQTYYVGNKEIYKFTKKTEGENSVIGEYTITINAALPNVYSLTYYSFADEESQDITLKGGVMTLEAVSLSQKTKKFKVINDYTTDKIPMLTSFYPLNCKVNVTYGKDETLLPMVDNYLQDVISTTHPDYAAGTYQYQVTFIDTEESRTYPDQLCHFYVATTPIVNGTELVVDENNPIEFILNKDISTIRFLFPRPPKSGEVIAYLNMESEAKLKLKLYVNNIMKSNSTFTMSRQFTLPEIKSDDVCNSQVCSIVYEFSALNEDEIEEGIHIEFSVKSRAKVPSFLRQRKFREDVVYSGNTQYYYTSVAKGDAGEVMINFYRGSGKVYGRLVGKEVVEENPNWNGKVVLPTKNSPDLIDNYDPFTKCLTYTEKDTDKCAQGCDLYIAVESDEKYNLLTEQINEFSIYLRTTNNEDYKKTIVDIPTNEYIFGAIEKPVTENYYEYFSFVMPYDVNEIIVEFQTETCSFYMNYGEERPSRGNANWTFNANGLDSINIIKKEGDPVIGGKDLNNTKFTIAIAASKNDSIYTAPYNFRIRAPHKDTPDIVTITTDQSVLCQTQDEGNGNYCDLLLLRRDYDLAGTLYMHAYGDTHSPLVFYVSVVEADAYADYTPEQVKAARPRDNKSNYNVTSKTTFNTDQLQYETEFTDKDVYILISIKAEKPSMITFLSTFRIKLKSMTPNPSTVQLFNMAKDEKLTLKMPANNNYILHVVSVEGTGSIQLDDDVHTLKGTHDALALTVPKNSTAKDLIINANTGGDFKFYFWYALRPSANFDEIEYASTGEVCYQNTDFPIEIYSKVEYEEDITINLNFLKFVPQPELTSNLFVVKRAVVNHNYILEKKANPTKEPYAVDWTDGGYDISLQQIKAQFKSEEMTTGTGGGQAYLLVRIEKHPNNKNSYNDIHAEISVLPSKTPEVTMPINEYHFGNLIAEQNTPNIYKLRKNEQSDTVIRLEFSKNSDLIDYAILEKPTGNLYKNTTAITYAIVENNLGKGIVDISVGASINEVYLSVFANTEGHIVKDEKLSNFAFRYRASSLAFTNLALSALTYSVTEIENNQMNVTITIPAVHTESVASNINFPSTYYVRVFDPTSFVQGEIINTISFINSHPEEIKSADIITEASTQISIIYTKKDELIIHCLGVTTTQDNHEIFSFKSISTNSEQRKQVQLETMGVIDETLNTYYTVFYKISFSSIPTDYVMIKTVPNENSSPVYIYFSLFDESPRRKSFIYVSDNDGTNVIYIPKALLTNKEYFNIGIECPNSNKLCSYKIEGSFMRTIELEKNSQYEYLTNDDDLNAVARMYRTSNTRDTLYFYAIGAAENDVELTVTYYSPASPKPIDVRTDMLFNGAVALVKESDLPDYAAGDYYELKIKCKITNVLVKIGVRENKSSTIIVPDSKAIYGYISTIKNVPNDCFMIQSTTSDQSYMVDVLTKTRNARILITHLDEHPEDDIEYFIDLQGQVKITDVMLAQNKYVCVTAKTGVQEVGYSIQVTKLSGITSTTRNIEPLVNGISYTKTLTYGQIQYYRHYKHYLDLTEETNFNVRVDRGNVETFVHTCTTYPDCSYTLATLAVLAMNNQLIYPRDIGGFHTIGVTGDKITNLLDETQTLLIVKCDSPTCVFKVSFFDEDDKMLLSEGVRFIQVMSKGQNDTYTFSIFNETTDIVLVELTTLAGDSNMSIKKEGLEPKLQTYYVGNKEIYKFTKKTEGENSVIGEYTITINAALPNVYSLTYYSFADEESQDITLKGGVMTLEAVSLSQKTKKFKVINDYTTDKIPMLTSFYPLNCKVNVTYGKDETLLPMVDNYLQDVISTTHPDYAAGTYQYQVTFIDTEESRTYPDQLCHFYVATTPIVNGTELVVDENNPIEFILNKDISTIRFLFPRPPKSGEVIAYLNMESEAKLKLKLYVNNIMKSNSTFTMSRQFTLPEIKSDDVCNSQVCSIVYEFSALNEDEIEEGIHIEFSVKSRAKVPSFLRQRKFREDVVYSGNTQYYYTSVAKGDAGEVMINFYRGSGKVYGRLVGKEVVEENPNWNGKVVLPTKNSPDLIDNYDPFTKCLTYTEKDTDKCAQGCDLYIAVESDEKYNLLTEQINEFSIYLRTTNNEDYKKTIVDIPTNEYIFGAIEKPVTENYYEYFSFVMPYDVNEIIVEFQTETCSFYMNYGEERPSRGNANWTFNANGLDSINIIKKEGDPVIGGKDLNNTKFTIAIAASKNDSIYTAPYNFRIRAPHKDTPDIVTITTDQSVLCQTQDEGNGNYCDLLLLRRDYDLAGTLYMHAYGDTHSPLVFYVSVVEADAYADYTPEQVKAARPRDNKSNYNVTSKTTFNTDQLQYETEFTDKDVYILISIKAEKPSMITFLSTFRIKLKSMTPNPSTVQLFNMAKDEKLTLKMPANNNYILHVVSVEGTGSIQLDDDVHTLKGTHDALALTVPKNSTAKDLIINANTGGDFKFYFWYALRPSANFDEIEYASTGEVCYQNTDFPIEIYSKVEYEEDITINLNFLKFVPQPELTSNLFVVKRAVVNHNYILEKKANPTKEPYAVDWTDGGYDISLQQIKAQFKSEEMTTGTGGGQAYLLVRIEKHPNNKNSYNDIHAEISVLPSKTPEVTMPINEYHFGNLIAEQNTPNIYKLRKNEQSDTVIRLEFSKNSDLIDYAILEKPTGNLYKNTTAITYAIVENNLGKGIVDISVGASINEVYLSVFANTEGHIVKDEKLSNFAFRYRASSLAFTNLALSALTYKSEETFNNQVNLTITIPTVFDKSTKAPISSNYYVRVFNPDNFTSEENIDSISFINIPPVTIYTKGAVSEGSVVISVLYTKETKYIIHCIGATSDRNNHELFSFKPVSTTSEQRKAFILETMGTIDETLAPFNVMLYDITYSNSSIFEYAMIKTVPNEGASPAYIYFSVDEQDPSRETFTLLSDIDGNNTIYIPRSLLDDTKQKFYIKVECEDSCSYMITGAIKETIELEKGEEYQYLVRLENQKNVVTIKRPTNSGDTLNFYVIGAKEGDVSFKLSYDFQNGTIKEMEVKNDVLFNGAIALIRESFDLGSVQNGTVPYYKLEITNEKPNVLVKVGSRIIGGIAHIKPDSKAVFGYIYPQKNVPNDCFTLDTPMKEGEVHYIEVVTRTKNVVVRFTNLDEHPEDDITHGVELQGFIKYDYTTRKNENIICIEGKAKTTNPVGFSLQIITSNLSEITTRVNEPLVDGISYTKTLVKGERQYYRHYKHYQDDTEETNFNVRAEKGDPITYVHTCKSYPKCIYTDNALKTLVEAGEIFYPRDIGGFHTIGVPQENITNLLDETQTLLIVKCDSPICVFKVSFFDEDDKMLLTEGARFIQVMNKGQNDTYEFTITDDDSIDNVIVEMNTIAGDSNMEIKKSGIEAKIQKYYVGNKEIWDFTKQKEGDQSMLGTYTITINAAKPNVYSIIYYSFADEESPKYTLKGGVMTLEAVQIGVSSRTFTITNEYTEQKVPMITSFYPLNCYINVTYVKGEQEEVLPMVDNYLQHVITSSHPDYSLGTYSYTVRGIGTEESKIYPDQLYQFYIATTPIIEGTELVVDEGNPTEFILNRDIQTMRFLFPRPPQSGGLIAYINLESEARLKLRLYVDNKLLSENVFTMSRAFDLPEIISDAVCATQVCSIVYEISASNEDEIAEGIHLEFSVKTRERVPSFLRKRKLREDVVYSGNTQYYYSSVAQGEEGEIMFNFNRGSGKIYARLIDKNVIESEPDWNGKIVLPTTKSTDIINNYDPFTKCLTYTQKDTEKCVNGCDLYIAVESDENYDKLVKEQVNEFSIYIRTTNDDDYKKSIVDFPTNEYVFGAIEKPETENYYEYFSFVMPYDADQIIIEFQSETCIFYMNYGDERPSKEDKKHQWKFSANGLDSINVIKKSDYKIIQEDLSNKKFTIAISANTLDSVYTSTYNFRIRVPHKGLPDIVTITSDQSALCQTDADGYCDLLIPRKDYDYINSLFLYAFGDTHSELQIYANIIDSEKYANFTKEEILAARPRKSNKDSYNMTSESEYYTDHLIVDWSQANVAEYLLVSIHADKPSMITVLSTFRTYLKSMTPNPSTVQVFHLYPNDEDITLNMPSNNDYIIHVVSIDGVGTVQLDDEVRTLRGTHDALALTLTTTITDKSIKIKTVDGGDFKFYFWYAVRPKVNFDEIEYGNTGEVLYQDTDFPIEIYSKVEYEEDINININFLKLFPAPEELTTNTFKVTGGVALQNDILQKKKNPAYVSKFIEWKDGSYDVALQQGKIHFAKDEITSMSGLVYLVVKIEKAETNKNTYKDIDAEISVLPSNTPDVVIPISQYHFGNLNETQPASVYKLRKNSKDDTIIRLEFSKNSDAINFAYKEKIKETNDVNEEAFYTNSTAIKVKEIENNLGKSIIDFQVGKDYNEILLSIFANNEQHKVQDVSLTNYVFKYRSSQEEFSNLSTGSITVNNSTSNDTFNFEFVVGGVKLNTNVVSASYYLKMYNTTTIKTNEILKTLAFTNNSPITLVSKTNVKEEQVKFNVSLAAEQNYTAIVFGVTEDKEYFIYQPYLIQTGKIDKPSNAGQIILIILLVLVIIAIIVALVFVYFTLKKKKNVLLKNVEHISFANDANDDNGGQDHLLESEPINSLA